jgi:hypothetical protein
MNHQGTKNTKGTKKMQSAFLLVFLVPWWFKRIEGGLIGCDDW